MDTLWTPGQNHRLSDVSYSRQNFLLMPGQILLDIITAICYNIDMNRIAIEYCRGCKQWKPANRFSRIEPEYCTACHKRHIQPKPVKKHRRGYIRPSRSKKPQYRRCKACGDNYKLNLIYPRDGLCSNCRLDKIMT